MRSIELDVDLTDVARRIVSVVADLPVQPGSTASFTTPLWICESHVPNGPVGNIAGVFFNAGRQTLRWRRDAARPHIFLVDVPAGVTTVRATFEALLSNHATRRMAMLVWESVLLHHAHVPVSKMAVQATIRTPRGWDYSTALRTESEEAAADGSHTKVTFKPVSVERLEDSPILIGQHVSKNTLTKDGRNRLSVAFSKPELTDIPQDRLDKLGKLVDEAASVFGPAPYEQYTFLSVSSDVLMPPENGASGGGLEHAESCHLITSGQAFADADLFNKYGDLISHEYVHVWNGKYRRPAGHVPSDFTTPLDGALLWVYEGLTQYYGLVLAARSGISDPEITRRKFATSIANMQCQSGRLWRSTEDTATGVSLTMGNGGRWSNWFRSLDYYDEGGLLWLDADTLIRERSNGQKSLDDFCRKFYDTSAAPRPIVVPYNLQEVTSTLNEVLPYDWASFIRERVQTPQPQVNTAGIERSGYKFVYTDKSKSPAVAKPANKTAIWHSIGLLVSGEGVVTDVQRYGAADKAGVMLQQKVTHVGGEKFSFEAMVAQIGQTQGKQGGITVSLEHDEDSWEAEICHAGLRYPALERQTGGPDMLEIILSPRVHKN